MAARKKGQKPAKAKKPAKKPAKKAAKKPAKKPAARRPVAAASAYNPWREFAAEYARESATTVRVMRNYPAEQPTFQPHPRSSDAAKLFWTFVVEQKIALGAIKGTLQLGGGMGTPPATLAESIAAFEQGVAQVVAAANAAKPDHWARLQPFYGKGGQIAQYPAGFLARIMFYDQIHHRGQLSVYVRMAGGKVPSIYGPSADEAM